MKFKKEGKVEVILISSRDQRDPKIFSALTQDWKEQSEKSWQRLREIAKKQSLPKS